MKPYKEHIMEPLISFKKVIKRFKNATVLKDISFDVLEGEIFGLIGASGAGKTTLLRCLIGFYEVSEGNILFKNENITKNLKEIRRIFGFTTQDNCFYEELTCKENLKYFGKLYRVPNETIKTNTERLLKMVELWDARDQIASNISGGMQRRLDLACSLIHNPQILILDEPTTGLDPMLRKEMWKLIEKINSMGITIIISSHLLEEMEQICTKVAMIKDGKILVKGTPDELKSLYSKNEEIHLETYPGDYKKIVDRAIKIGIPISYVRQEGHKVVLYVSKAERALHEIIHILEDMNESLLDIDVNKPSLNEVFEAFTNRK